MKKFRIMAMALMAVAMCANFASCSNEDSVIDEPKGDEYVTVKLGCGGELLDIKNSPLSRAEGDKVALDAGDLLLLSIVELTQEGSYYYENSNYAYAVMPYQDEIELNLLKGKYYRVYASIIIDGKDNGYSTDYELEEGSIVYSTSYSINYAMTEQNYQYEYDRFYGMLNDFQAVEDADINVDLYRVAYAAELVASGLAESESLQVKFSRYSDEYSSYYGDYTTTLEYETASDYRVRTMRDISYAWECAVNGSEYEETRYLTIIYNKNVANEEGVITGTEECAMGTYPVPFKRNAKTTVTIVPQDLSAGGTLTVSAEAWGADVNFQIEGGQVTEQ